MNPGLWIPLSAFLNLVPWAESCLDLEPQSISEVQTAIPRIVWTFTAYTLYLFVNAAFRPLVIFTAWYIASYDHWRQKQLSFWGAVTEVAMVLWCGISVIPSLFWSE